MINISATIGKDHYKTVVQTAEGHQLIADEPEDLGGGNLGFAPDDLLASALATCGIITMRMYADRKGWPVESIKMTVLFERDENTSRFEKQISFVGPLDDAQKQRLLNISDKCPVHKTLSNPIEIKSVIVEINTKK